ncbi:MAG: hypothetical protein AAF702_40605 [Chloroflexota bacterium]
MQNRFVPYQNWNHRGFTSMLFLVLALLLTACNGTMPNTPAPTSSPDSESLGEAIAFITYADGAASNLYSAYQALREGQEVQAPEGSTVTFICQNGYVYRVQDGQTVIVTNERCESGGQTLPNSGQERTAPDEGRIRENNGSLELEEGARDRESDYGRIPVILAPRNTRLADLAPAIRWTAVADAIEYELSLSALEPLPEIIIDAEELTCELAPQFDDETVCQVEWPTAEWPLAPDERYFLTVSARIDFAGPLRPSERSSLRTLSQEDSTALQAELDAIAELDLDPLTPKLLQAGAYASYQLINDIIPLYEEVLAIQPAPELYITVGDLYRRIELERYAFARYQAALEMIDANDPETVFVQAAAAHGQALAYYSRDNFAEAKEHFAKAAELYRQAGAEEKAEMAEIGEEEAAKRVP